MSMASSMNEPGLEGSALRAGTGKRATKRGIPRPSRETAEERRPKPEPDEGTGGGGGAGEGSAKPDSARARKWLVLWALLLGSLTLGFYELERTQDSPGKRWDPDGAVSASWFIRPVETDRWRRPGSDDVDVGFHAVQGAGNWLLAAGDAGVLLRSADAGVSWSVLRAPVGAAPFVSIAAAEAGALLAVDGHAVWRSTDGGVRWEATQQSVPVRAIAAAPGGRLAVAVGDRVLLRSENGGRNWKPIGAPGAGTAQGERPLPARAQRPATKQSVGGKAAPRSTGGEPPELAAKLASFVPTIRPQDPLTEAMLKAAVFVDARTVLVGGDRGIFRSTDGGENWERVAITPLNVTSLAAGGASVLAATDGAVARSVDGGLDWKAVNENSSRFMRAVAIGPDGNTAIAVGDGGALLRSDNGGGSWLPASSGTTANLASAAVLPGLKAFAAGDAGTLLRSAEGGQRWSSVGQYARYPAPWFDTLFAILLVASGVALVRALRRDSAQVKKDLLDNAVSDRPISKAEQDRLAFTPVVEAMSLFLRHAGTAPPLAIAINAPWGMGKTSFMGMLVERLRSQGARPVWFNVWHHQHEETLLAPLLSAITHQAVPNLWHWTGWRFRARLLARRVAKIDWPSALGLLGLLSVPAYMVCLSLRASATPAGVYHLGWADRLVRDIHASWDVLTGGEWLTAATGDLGKLLASMVDALRSDATHVYWLVALVFLFVCLNLCWTYLLRPFPANPAVLVAGLGKRFKLSDAEAKTDFRQEFQRHFADVAHALAPRTLTVFIDDLDRCRPDKAAELLEAVNYLAESGPCFVVLGMARELVEAQIASAHKQLAEEQAKLDGARARRDGVSAGDVDLEEQRLRYARKYLRKLVQLDVQLPSVSAEQARQLLLQRAASARGGEESGTAGNRMRVAAERFTLPASLIALVIGLSAAIGWQWLQTRDMIQQELAATKRGLDQQVQALYDSIAEKRGFEQWLRFQAETARAVGAEAKIPDHRAHAELVAAHLKLLEAALPELEKNAREGRATAFENLRKASFLPHENQVVKLQDLHREWRKDAGAAQSTPVGSPKTAAADTAAAATNPRAQVPVGKPILRAGTVPDSPNWPLVLAIGPTLLLLVAALLRRDEYVIEATDEYSDAVKQWNAQLSGNADTSSPRELKRFMNLSRYVVARRKTDAAPEAQLEESRIVEFTAKWLLGRALAVSSPLVWMLKGMAADSAAPVSLQDEAQARWFLQVVGDISG